MKPFAEVIESSLNIWTAQSWQWDNFPSFGSLVKVNTNNRSVFGIVYDIKTGSVDSSRTVIAYQKTEEELKREQPQIFEFIQTTFTCLTLGYEQDNVILYQVSPEPPKIHSFVSTASQSELINFFSSEYYLHMLFSFSRQILSLDELLLSIIKNLSDLNLLNEEILENFISAFSFLTANDYRRLKLFLQRAHPILKINNKTHNQTPIQ